MLSVIIPAYSSVDAVERSAAAIAASRLDDDVEIVLVLNRELGALNLPGGVRILPFEGNAGFAGGVARGIAGTSGEWLATVNDDCVVEPQSLQALLDAGRSDPRVGAVAGLLVFADRPDVVNSAGIVVDELGVASERLVGCPVDEAFAGSEVFGASGAFALYRRAMLEDVGGFDATFFAYLEDVDLAWRAQMADWRCLFEPRARALHAHSKSFGHASPAKHFLVGRNRVRLLAKNATGEQLRRRAASILLYDSAYVAWALVRHRSLSPLRGRLTGLREWRRYRAVGAASRVRVSLASPPGLLAALRRDRAYARS
jgi:GT2 family glycosyltransferase